MMKKDAAQDESLILIPREELTSDGLNFAFGAGDEMAFYMRFYRHNEAFSHVFPAGRNARVVKDESPAQVTVRDEIKGAYRHILLPNAPKRMVKSLFGSTTLKGRAFSSGMRALIDFQSSQPILSLEPLLATGGFFPDNEVCGFTAKGKGLKYVFLLHTKEDRHYKGGESVRPLFASMMYFKVNGLERIWGFLQGEPVPETHG
jgi:hypothetical protein